MNEMYNITWGQCSAMIQNRLESGMNYEIINAHADIAELLKEIRNISNELKVSDNVYDVLYEVKRKYFPYSQQYDKPNIKHVKNIKDLIATIEHYGGSVCTDEGLLMYEKKKGGNITTNKNYEAMVKGKFLGCAVIKRVNAERCGDLLKNLRVKHSYGQDLYPDIMEVAHNMLSKRELLNPPKKKPVDEKNAEGDDRKDDDTHSSR